MVLFLLTLLTDNFYPVFRSLKYNYFSSFWRYADFKEWIHVFSCL